MILNIDYIKFSITSISDSTCVMKTSYFITVQNITFNDTIHSYRSAKRNADPDVRVDFDVISNDVQTSHFLHIPVKSIGKPYHTCVISLRRFGTTLVYSIYTYLLYVQRWRNVLLHKWHAIKSTVNSQTSCLFSCRLRV